MDMGSVTAFCLLLTLPGRLVITSDFWDPETLEFKRKTAVIRLDGSKANNINELEYWRGRIIANVWFRDYLLVIHPETGKVEKEYDFTELWSSQERTQQGAEVLNGISVSSDPDLLYLTGKYWDRTFLVQYVFCMYASLCSCVSLLVLLTNPRSSFCKGSSTSYRSAYFVFLLHLTFATNGGRKFWLIDSGSEPKATILPMIHCSCDSASDHFRLWSSTNLPSITQYVTSRFCSGSSA